MRLEDFDGDGRIDVVTAPPGPAWKDRATTIRVFRNEIANGHHWLKVRPQQPGGNSMALGATVTVLESGTRRILGTRVVGSDTAGCHPRLHFGLAEHTRVDLEVRFPANGGLVAFPGLRADRSLELRPDGAVEERDGRGRE